MSEARKAVALPRSTPFVTYVECPFNDCAGRDPSTGRMRPPKIHWYVNAIGLVRQADCGKGLIEFTPRKAAA